MATQTMIVTPEEQARLDLIADIEEHSTCWGWKLQRVTLCLLATALVRRGWRKEQPK